MKKLLTIMLAAAVSASAWCKPMFVGHRGSGQGLENSVESFTIGAKRGYQYLETDWKLTKDKQFVCSHDDDTKRLGGTLTLAGSTLAELQAETLIQTRSGVKYTGRLCSAKEYLDVCREYNVIPVIELKWTTGINSNDQSNIPMLIKFIEDNGFRNKCVILTSMKPCLEYIRKNYPDIELQFLTGQYWANHFDWCVEHGIDVDIQTGYFDKNTIDKFHDAGLDVNIWTANSNTDYKKYGDWGVDFITTDHLDPASVPELDPLSAVRPNKTDYPETSASARGWFLPELENSFEWPSELAAGDVRRMVYSGGWWQVLTSRGGVSSISAVSATTGKTGRMLTAPEELSDIACGSDGAVYGVSAAGTAVYRWSGASDQAEKVYEDATAESYDGCHRIAVSGPATNAYVYVSTSASAGEALKLITVDLKGGVATHFATVPFASGVTASQLGDYRLAVTPTARENILVESPLTAAVEYRLERQGSARLNVFATAPAGIGSGRSYCRRGLKVYGLVPVADGGFSAVFTDLDGGIAAGSAVSDALTPAVEAGEGLVASAIDIASNRLLLAGAGRQLNSYVLDTYAAPAQVEDVEIKIERLWLNSVSTGNAPENIDGTNAQQGTAVNGLIMVNDCVKKEIFAFDKSGCIGSMPGGSGWGICRDDAGNIIVRDDKLTGTSHSFMVYPAGSTPASHGEPVRFEATVPLGGQTNFINASGDVLGNLGYIYLYPNKQTAVNVIRMSHGAVKGATASGEVTMTGSAAGYVVPIDNNSENWIYHVRAYGISEYAAGVNTEVMGGRGNTTSPNRNTTGGLARFVLRGNVLLAHNSGSNYVGGFTLRNFSKGNAVIESFAPIGDKGYATGGNYSTFNWLIPEAIDEDSYHLYQYCPANGMGLYRVYVADSGVDDIAADSHESVYALDCDGMTLRVTGAGAGDLVCVYSLSGSKVAEAHGASVDVSSLARGIYTVSVNGRGHSLKFVK